MSSILGGNSLHLAMCIYFTVFFVSGSINECYKYDKKYRMNIIRSLWRLLVYGCDSVLAEVNSCNLKFLVFPEYTFQLLLGGLCSVWWS